MTDLTQVDPFAAADRLAPIPESRDAASNEAWSLHFAATALAAHVVFRETLRTVPRGAPGSRPDLGYLSMTAAAAIAAAAAFIPKDDTAGLVYDLMPGYGANNGEDIEWVSQLLDALGVNPADIDPRYNAADFRSPSRPA